jgi:prepilin-type N-terminal cleavage/methylation domain-containing protein
MKKKGFTLIELLVVIAIIGILSSVVVVSLNSARMKARDAKRVADLGQIKTALGLYFDSYQQYPADLTSLSSEFLAAQPVPPNVGESYSYAVSTDGLSYHLGATMEQVASTTGVLASDRDCSSLVADSCWAGAAAAANGFSGADPVYDLTP